MELRPELTAPPLDPARVAEFIAEIERIEQLVWADHPDADEAIARFNESGGHDYEPSDFIDFDERSVQDLAREAARPAHPVVADVTRAELAELVRRSRLPSEDRDYYRRLFDVNVVQLRMRLRASGQHAESPDPAMARRNPAGPAWRLTPEQVVDAALRFRPIAL